MQVFLVVVLGALTGPLFDAGYLRPLLLLGCTLIVFGMAMLSLATAYWEVFLAQALCVGLGAGLIYVPSLAFVSTLFDERHRPWAIGVANSGGSAGGLIFTFMLRRLEPTIGFPWAVRAVALVNLVLAVVVLAIILPHRPPPQSHKRALFDLSALREPNFIFFAFALFFSYVAFYIPPFYVPTYATAVLHKSQDFAFDALAVVSAGSAIGRTIPMLAAPRMGILHVYLLSTAGAGILLFSWISIHSVPSFLAFCAWYGILSGVLVSAPSAAVSHPVLSPSMNVIGTRMGMGWMFGGAGVLIGSPIAGALANVHKARFAPAQAFAGAMLTAGGLCLIVPLVAVLKYNKRNVSLHEH